MPSVVSPAGENQDCLKLLGSRLEAFFSGAEYKSTKTGPLPLSEYSRIENHLSEFK